jgi:hypothetical protein
MITPTDWIREGFFGKLTVTGRAALPARAGEEEIRR